MRVALLGQSYNYAYGPEAYMRGGLGASPAVDAERKRLEEADKARLHDEIREYIKTFGKIGSDVVDTLADKYGTTPEKVRQEVGFVQWAERNQAWLIGGAVVLGVGVLVAMSMRRRRRRR